MTVASCSMGNAQVRISTQSQRGVIWACVLVLAVFGGACALSPCAMAQVSAAAQAEIDKFCAKHRTDVKKTNDDGETLLHIAAEKEGVAVVRFLIEKGADVNEKSNFMGYTPLQLAATYNHENLGVIKLLVENGADVNTKTNNGDTPLHFAARWNENPEVTKLLIEKGADVNAKTNGGYTPLHNAAEQNKNPEVIKLLIEKGADVNAKDKDGKTPLQLNAKIREYLSQVQRNAFLASAIDLNAEIKKSGLGSISEYVQYGASDLRKKLQEADEFDQPGIKAQIEAKKGKIAEAAFVGRYPYSTSNVKVEGDVSSVMITLDTGFSAMKIEETVSLFPDVKCTAIESATSLGRIISYAFLADDDKLRPILPSEECEAIKAVSDTNGFLYARFQQQSTTTFTLSGKTDSIKELVRGKDGYRIIVWFTNLSGATQLEPTTYFLVNSDGTLRKGNLGAAKSQFVTDREEVVKQISADVLRIEIVKQ